MKDDLRIILVRRPVRSKSRYGGNNGAFSRYLPLAVLGTLLLAGLLLILAGVRIMGSPSPGLLPSQAGRVSFLPLAVASSPSLQDPHNGAGEPVPPTIQAGETPAGIGEKYEAPLEEPKKGVEDPAVMNTGQVIFIPLALAAETPIPPASPTRTPAPPAPATVNEVPVEEFAVLSGDVSAHIQEIYTRGQALGRKPGAFSKLGDSIIENPHFLARFDEDAYNLGDYVYLQRVIDHYQGSFGRQGVAVRRGLHSWSVFDPKWSDKALCEAGETVIACEFRLHNPSVVLIRLGSNDVGLPDYFDENMRQVVEYAVEQGVIPVLITKSDRREGTDNINNRILREIASDFAIPLWDFDRVADTIPNRGLYPNDVHLTTYYAHDYDSPEAFRTGHGVHNLTGLIVLDKILAIVSSL